MNITKIFYMFDCPESRFRKFRNLTEAQTNSQIVHRTKTIKQRWECSGQFQCIVCDISIPPSMPASLKDPGQIKAELLRGSEDWVVGEGIKTLNENAPYSLGNQNKDTKRTTNTVKHFSLVCIHKSKKAVHHKNTTAEPLKFQLPCNQRAKISKSEFSRLLHGTVI